LIFFQVEAPSFLLLSSYIAPAYYRGFFMGRPDFCMAGDSCHLLNRQGATRFASSRVRQPQLELGCKRAEITPVNGTCFSRITQKLRLWFPTCPRYQLSPNNVQARSGSLKSCNGLEIRYYSTLHLPMWSAKPQSAFRVKPSRLASSSVPDYPRVQELRYFHILPVAVFAFSLGY
jgi:hypothetical protein